MPVLQLDHPLIQHKLGLMREANISTRDFRQLTHELGALLTYEATRDLSLIPADIQTWQGTATIQQVEGKKLTLVPILRAGLGMLNGVLELIPNAKVSVVGLYRDKETLEPVPYYEKLATDLPKRSALVLDPILATGGSMIAAIDLLKRAGCQSIKALVIIASEAGIQSVLDAHPDVHIYTASIDPMLTDKGYVLPGLGDAGDKIFGTK